jgi:dephospho-CoA kinase
MNVIMRDFEPSPTHSIIGLTGNIGTGKSLVRKMLEHCGALGIDADRLTQDLLKEDSPAYTHIIKHFGNGIVDNSGRIDRKKLGEIVFSNPQELKALEAILHPWVSTAAGNIIRQAPAPVVVIEAIKLLESDLARQCDSIWVVDAQAETVYQRLKKNRGMTRAQVNLRLAQQSSAAEKKHQANFIIQNSGTSRDTWEQVLEGWQSHYGTMQPPAEMKNVLLPTPENLELATELLDSYPESPVNQYLKGCMRKDLNLNGLEKQDLLFQSMLQSYLVKTGKDDLSIWINEHFNCRMEAYSVMEEKAKERSRKLKTMTVKMETFGRYHLCSSFFIRANRGDESFIESLGYHKQLNKDLPRQDNVKARYNLYTKKYPSKINLYEV